MPQDAEALAYHRHPKPGKIEIQPSKPCLSQADLSLAYTPGVGAPCLEIQSVPNRAYAYTVKGNLVGVITNGTAVLGLGDIGPLAAKPVMEGKAVLFKRFADLDVFDIEVTTRDPDQFVEIVRHLEPTFGGINLEDIKAPECFYIEEKLKQVMNIPVFHDDQHGTAIISAAALLNACALTSRKPEELKVVINGAGAAGIACAKMYLLVGVKRENILLLDSQGVIHGARTRGMNPYKAAFAAATRRRSLAEAAQEADALVGLSVKGAFTPEVLKSMAPRPIIFALANPDPEIDYHEAKALRPDAIVATGRSDYPNQVNNVLGFPFIFRGALDVRASKITREMKVAAVRALARLARQDVPDSVIRAYGGEPIRFGPDYIIPKPLDSRVLLEVAPAVAQAAAASGVAGKPLLSPAEYLRVLEAKLGPEREIMRKIIIRAQQDPKRIVLPEGNHPVILRAAHQVAKQRIAVPVVLGNAEEIRSLAAELQIPLEGVEIVDQIQSKLYESFVPKLFELRSRKGWSLAETRRRLRSRYVTGAMMVRQGLVDGQVHGISRTYPDAIRPVLQVIPRRPGIRKVSGLYLMIGKERIHFFADTTVNIRPESVDLAETAILAADTARFFDVEPRVAMISFSNFGSVRHGEARRVADAVELIRRRRPDIRVDGEMQADTALQAELLASEFPFNRLGGAANVLVFPDLAAGNVAYKLLAQLGGTRAVGPLLMGIGKPFNVLQRGSDMENVVNVIAITVAQAQESRAKAAPKRTPGDQAHG